MAKLGNTGMTPMQKRKFDEACAREPRCGLILHHEWCQMILDDGKTWEIRGQNSTIRGRIALIVKDRSYGEVSLVDSMPLDQQAFDANREKHKVASWTWVTDHYKTPHVWILQDVKRYTPPREVTRYPGQVVWVRIAGEYPGRIHR